MITIGVDTHKHLHVAVALAPSGQPLSSWQGPNSADGWSSFMEWLAEFGDEVEVGIEGARSYGWGLSHIIIARGVTAYEVNSRLTSLERKYARQRGKSDSLDATAVARAVQREAGALPRLVHDEDCEVLAQLTEERDTLLAEATRVRNRLHASLSRLDPEYKRVYPKLDTKATLSDLQSYPIPAYTTELTRILIDSIRRMAGRLSELLETTETLKRELEQRATPRFQSLTQIRGVKELTAAVLAGILGTHAPFRTDAQLASYAGVSPIPASSAGGNRHRLNRGGNRKLNAVIYRIAVAQLRHPGPAQDYVSERRARGSANRDSMRSLKRYIVRAIWKVWTQLPRPPAPQTSFACL
jgi:transposase